jgi:hypothetical protein
LGSLPHRAAMRAAPSAVMRIVARQTLFRHLSLKVPETTIIAGNPPASVLILLQAQRLETRRKSTTFRLKLGRRAAVLQAGGYRPRGADEGEWGCRSGTSRQKCPSPRHSPTIAVHRRGYRHGRTLTNLLQIAAFHVEIDGESCGIAPRRSPVRVRLAPLREALSRAPLAAPKERTRSRRGPRGTCARGLRTQGRPPDGRGLARPPRASRRRH